MGTMPILPLIFEEDHPTTWLVNKSFGIEDSFGFEYFKLNKVLPRKDHLNQ